MWETNDNEISGDDHLHRQFSFHFSGKDEYGNNKYYIQLMKDGQWVGTQDNKAEQKTDIVKTSKENRKEWIVTNATVPLTGNEDSVLSGDLKDGSHGYCEFFSHNSLDAICLSSALTYDGQTLHHYTLGISSKWIVEWREQYQAFKIYMTGDRESWSDKVIDIKDSSNKYGRNLNLWSDQSLSKNKNTSQLWRFLKLPDESYQIQNAMSGRCVGDNGDDELCQNSRELGAKDVIKYNISVFNGCPEKSSKFVNEVNYEYADPWMSKIADSTPLSLINIPGTHDTGTQSIGGDGFGSLSFTRFQKLYYGSQLNVGARAFDIRARVKTDNPKPEEVNIVHSNTCYDRDGSTLLLEDIFNDSVRFLREHDTETIILNVKINEGSDIGLAREMGRIITDDKYEDYIYQGSGIPALGEAIGKIILFRRYNIDTPIYDSYGNIIDNSRFGTNLSSWDSNDFKTKKQAVQIYKDEQMFVYAQDAYDVSSSNKKKYVKGTIEQTASGNSVPENSYIYNYTSAVYPLTVTSTMLMARSVNPWFYSTYSGKIDNKRVGIIMMDFIDAPMAKMVYESNF